MKAAEQQELQKSFYDGENPQYLEYEKNIPYAQYLIQKVIGFLSPRASHVLEIGAGQGRFTFELSKHVQMLTATDFSKHEITLMQRYIKAHSLKNIKSAIVDALVMTKDLDHRRFDHLVGFFVLHHIPKEKYHQLIGEMYKTIKPGGTIVLIEPNNYYPFHLVEMICMPHMAWEIEKQIYSDYIDLFIRESLRHKLQIVRCERFGFFPPFLINIWPGITSVDECIGKIPLVRTLLTPFVCIVVKKRS